MINLHKICISCSRRKTNSKYKILQHNMAVD